MTETLATYLSTRHIRPSDLARKAGYKNSSTIANWLEGDVLAPYQPNVERVAKALNISTDTLFDMIAEGYYEKHPQKRPPIQAHSDPPDLAPAA